MRSVWSCSSCVAFFVMALLGQEAMAASQPEEVLEMDMVHRVPKKPQITPPPQPLRQQLKRRGDDELTCPGTYTACPASLGGGCCPGNYDCASDSCTATTKSLGVACGRTGYFQCAITAGREFSLSYTPFHPAVTLKLTNIRGMLSRGMGLRHRGRLYSTIRRNQHIHGLPCEL